MRWKAKSGNIFGKSLNTLPTPTAPNSPPPAKKLPPDTAGPTRKDGTPKPRVALPTTPPTSRSPSVTWREPKVNDEGCYPRKGRQINDASSCKEDLSVAACVEIEEGADCGASITEAVAPDGSRWIFSDTCIPDGWQELQGGGGLYDLPECSSP